MTDYLEGVFPLRARGPIEKGRPQVLVKVTKDRLEDRAWEKTIAAVDARDKGLCFVTGAYLKAGAVDPWQRLERAHLEARSKSKARRYVAENVVTVSAAIHQLMHAGALKLFDKRGRPALKFEAIDHVAWNRTLVAKDDEPCRLRKGLAVRELAA